MSNSSKGLYFVAVKVFLLNNGKLFIFKDGFGKWDLPGGRIRENEFSKPLERILARKMKEELGSSVKYRLGKPAVFMRHERMELLPNGKKERRRIFAIGYEAEFIGGAIKLPSHHTKYLWVSLKNFQPQKYFTGGWLKGVEEYLRLKNRKA